MVQSVEPVITPIGVKGERVREVIAEGWARMVWVGLGDAVGRIVSVGALLHPGK
jgi:hypothetical protein